MHYLLTILLSLIISNIYAHDKTNWLLDRQAYQFTYKHRHIIKRNLIQARRHAYALKYNEGIFKSIDPQVLRTINNKLLKFKLEQLSGARAIQLPGQKPFIIKERRSKKNKNLALKFLAFEFQQVGFQTKLQNYNSGINFIAEKKGNHPNAKTLVLSGHLDSVGNAGANDDGTSMIAALAIAIAMKDMNFQHNLQIVAFDQEELGLIGSRQFVKKIADKKQIIADIQLEMMGTNSRRDGAFHIIDCKKPQSVKITNMILKSIQQHQFPLAHVPGCTNRSDHANFWRENIPAVVISENFFGGDSDKCYHRRCDIVDDRINFDYMRYITLAVFDAIKKILVELD
jgi:hypothetical protein